MKLVILNVLTMVFAFSANARTPIPFYQYDMSSIKIDGTLVPNEPNMTTEGKLTVDFVNNKITAYAQQSPNCDPDKMCPKFLISLMQATAKIVDVKQNTCSTVYTAEDNKMIADGQNIKIVFESYENTNCLFVVMPVPKAVITVQGYNMFEGPQIYETIYELTF